MKILIISLLRIGDIAMSSGILRDLRAKYPDAQIDLLMNAQCAQIAPMLNSIDRVFKFDRQGLQQGLGDAAIPFFESYEKLNEILEEMGEETYDLCINLTQNRLSGWLMGLIEAKEKIGLVLDHDGRAIFSSNWFKYLNSQVDQDGNEVFHFNDIFRSALGLSEFSSNSPSLVQTSAGRAEADIILNGAENVVCVQAITSDIKKDWSVQKFAAALGVFADRHPETTLVVLSAPFEKERLEPLVQILKTAGHDAILAVSSFEAAYSLVARAKLVITLDTSIKHLAAAAGTPILEICLGSSDPYRTGADLNAAVIVRSLEACAPCTHSKACHRESRFCASGIPSDAVALLASEIYSQRKFQLGAIAREYSKEIEVLHVDRKTMGFWVAASLTEPFTEQSVGRWIDLVCKKMWIDGSQTLGSETLKLSAFFKTLHPKVSEIEWRHLLEDFERRSMEIEGRINGFKAGIKFLHGCYEQPKKMSEFIRGLISFREKIRTSPLFTSFQRSLDQVIEDDISPAFTRFRRMNDVISEIDTRTQSHLRILRTLTLQLNQDNDSFEQERL